VPLQKGLEEASRLFRETRHTIGSIKANGKPSATPKSTRATQKKKRPTFSEKRD